MRPLEEMSILIVEDSRMFRKMEMDMLAKVGFKTIHGVSSASEAYEVLGLDDDSGDAPETDLILMDIVMENEDGISACRRIKEAERFQDIPIVMLTSLTEKTSLAEAFQAGAIDYITKPVDKVDLSVRVRSALKLKRETDERKDRERKLIELNNKLETRNLFIRSTFGRYMSDEVVESLLETPGALELGGDKRKVSVMMTDLRGFSSFSEKLPPESVVEALNVYLGVMMEIVSKYKGVIGDFIGDGMMIIFGAPTLRDDDAYRAVACAVEMQLAMEADNELSKHANIKGLEMGIGINSGVVVAGNIGSNARVKYGVVGSAVNLAARIESYTVGGQILISDSILDEVKGRIITGKRLKVSMKGIVEQVAVSEVFGVTGEHELTLERKGSELVALKPAIPVFVAVLISKSKTEPEMQGEIMKLSDSEAVLKAEIAVDPLSDMKITLTDGNLDAADRFVYAKVMEGLEEDACLIRFTSMPSAAAKYFTKLTSQ